MFSKWFFCCADEEEHVEGTEDIGLGKNRLQFDTNLATFHGVRSIHY